MYAGAARAGGGGSYLTEGAAGFVGGAAGALYGTPTLVPLIGGSGGGGGGSSSGASGAGGGGGGGALLIASGTSAGATTITVNGAIWAKGGGGGPRGPGGVPMEGGGGSGGAVRLVAQTITGSGSVDVRGGPGSPPPGGMGRIRLEMASYTGTLNLWQGWPPPIGVSTATPSPTTLTNSPWLTITSVGGVSAPGTLTGAFATPDFVLPAGTANPTVTFAGSGIPLGTTVSVVVTGQMGGVISTATSGGLSGTVASSTASASVTVPTDQASLISASVSFTVADAGGGPLYADGEPVDRVVVTARLGGGSEVRYVTVSGRAIVVASAR